MVRHVWNLHNEPQATVNVFAKNIFNCGNDKLIHATRGMTEQWHTTMVSLLMHQPAFGKKKWMGIKCTRNHIPRIQLIQQDTTMVWSSMNPSGRHTMMVSSLVRPPAFGKKKWMGINCLRNHVPQIQLIQEQATVVWLSMNPSAFSKKNKLLLKQQCSHVPQFSIVKMNCQILIPQE